jgi:hypothetical protein
MRKWCQRVLVVILLFLGRASFVSLELVVIHHLHAMHNLKTTAAWMMILVTQSTPEVGLSKPWDGLRYLQQSSNLIDWQLLSYHQYTAL